MTIKYLEDHERICMRCGEYSSTWQVRAELMCKYCERGTRDHDAPIMNAILELIPLE